MVGLQVLNIVLTLRHLPFQFESAFNDIVVFVDFDPERL